MREASEGTGGSSQMPDRVIEALDEVTILSDILTLLFWAGEGIEGAQGAAVARGALIAQERLRRLILILKTDEPPQL